MSDTPITPKPPATDRMAKARAVQRERRLAERTAKLGITNPLHEQYARQAAAAPATPVAAPPQASAPSVPSAPRAPQIKRTPFNGGSGRYRLHSPELEAHFTRLGFHIAFLNDTGDQIWRAEQAGYSKVSRKELPGHLNIGSPDVGSGDTSLDSAVSRYVGTDKHGKSMHAFLMKQPQEFFEEDEKARQQPVDAIEQELRRGRFVSGSRAGQSVSNSYGDVKIGTTGSE